MTIGMKWWAEGGSVPGSFTNVDVSQCHPRELYEEYDRKQSFDGTKKAWNRKYLAVDIVFPKKSLSDATTRATLMTIVNSTYFRVSDTRHASLGGANTINFIHASPPSITREGYTLLGESLFITLVSESPV